MVEAALYFLELTKLSILYLTLDIAKPLSLMMVKKAESKTNTVNMQKMFM